MHRRVTIILLASALCLGSSLGHAQTEQQLADLKVLFEKDPAAGFVEAERLFEKPEREGDLAGMMAILTIVQRWSEYSSCWGLCTLMAEAALPVAMARGDWVAVGDIRWAQAAMAASGRGLLRMDIVSNMATEAYARAGREPPLFTAWKAQVAPTIARHREMSVAAVASFGDLPADIRPAFQSFFERYERAEDTRACALAGDLLAIGRGAPFWVRKRIVAWICVRLPLPGGEQLLPELRAYVLTTESRADANDLIGSLMLGCAKGYSGHRDPYLATYQWCLEQLFRSAAAAELPDVQFLPTKCVRLRQYEMADQIVRSLLDFPAGPAHRPVRWYGPARYLVHPGIAPDLRRRLVQEQLAYYDWVLRNNQPDMTEAIDGGYPGWLVADSAPESERATWCLETGYQIADYAPNFPTAASRSRAATEAASYFEKAGRPDLATEAREMAVAFAADDPRLRLRVALAAGQSAARAGKWEDVLKGLEPVMARITPSGQAVQAALLLRQAQVSLGDQAEATRWLATAQDLLERAKLPASERTGYLMTLADVTPDRTKTVALLKQAEGAAAEAQLEPLRERVNQQLAALAVASGDLVTAEKALQDTIGRLEGRREALAFDRILRQQWFADNLGPYQKLLRVEALLNNPGEALAVAEKMRARALSDQLAWQKVDLGVRLSPETRQRLAALREARTKTYALLQRAMGGEQLTATDLRGAYLPIRGAYLPIRGPLLGEQPVTEADLKELRGLLDTLAKEEAALASAVREQVPAYAAASEAPVLTGTRLLEEVSAQKDLVLLHYTLCEGGVVVVACGPGSRPKVALLPVKADDLWQQIGKFRELIWERKPEANDEAVKLYNLLVQPVEGVFYGAKRLWVVGDGALQLLPFGALIGSDRQYLLSRFAVATTPSLTLALSSRGKRPAGKGAVVLAAPETGALALADGGDKRGAYLPIRGMYLPVRGAYLPIRGEGISTALTAMALVPLPGAKAEGEALGKLLTDPTVLTDKQATRAKLLQAGSECDLLHIATHGYADPDVPEFSGLLLAGEGEQQYDTLTALDIYMWSLKARLVTLSACQTALGKTVAGEGVMGLSRAFLYAGAQDVLCTLWPVADESTKALMVAFYENLAQKQSIEEALRNAQVALAAKPETAHPFFWAGFTAVRGPE